MTRQGEKIIPIPTTLKVPQFSNNARTVLERRYLIKDETGQVMEEPIDMLWRVANTIAAGELNYNKKADIESLGMQFIICWPILIFCPTHPP